MFHFEIQDEQIAQITKYYLKVLKRRAIGDSDYSSSTQFSDLTKRNFHKLLHRLMSDQKPEGVAVKSSVIQRLLSKIIKSINQSKTEKKVSHKVIEYLCFMIKTAEDCFKKI